MHAECHTLLHKPWCEYTALCSGSIGLHLHVTMLLTAGLEPHSALPTALPMMFNRFCRALPSALRDIKILATSAVSVSSLTIVYNIACSRKATLTGNIAASKQARSPSCKMLWYCPVCTQSTRVITHSVHAEECSQCLWCVQAFYLPATKHPWWWLGIRSIDKKSFGALLKANNSVVLVPGGVSECMVMKHGQPTVSGNQHALLIPLLVF